MKPTHQRKVSSVYQKSIRNPSTYPHKLIKPASTNKKLGNGRNKVTKGKWRGLPMFSLTLVERETCPESCHHWDDCYGNNMPFAHRFRPNEDFLNALEREISELTRKHHSGIVLRLHVLGDFYSVNYCSFWLRMLIEYPNLRIFGYTARANDEIGNAIQTLRLMFPERFWIRISRNEEYWPDIPQTIFAANENFEGEGITCPQQTGKTESCLTCGLCWSVNKTIVFKDH